MNKKIIIILLLQIFSAFLMYATTWEAIYGGIHNDIGYDIIKAWDEGYIIVGASNSFGDLYYDLWIIKIDDYGNTITQNRYNLLYNENLYSIIKTSDGGYAAVGAIDVLTQIENYWIIKFNNNLQIQWQKYMGKDGEERANEVVLDNEGNFIAVGYTNTYGNGLEDIWVTKFNNIGQFLSYKTYGGNAIDVGQSIVPTDDGGYLVAANTNSFSVGNYDILLLKLNSNCEIEWQRLYVSPKQEWAYSLIKAHNHGYIIAGYNSNDSLSQKDILIMKINNEGQIDWSYNYSTYLDEVAYKIIRKSNNEYLIIGYIETNDSADNILLLSINESGEIQWQKMYGGNGYDRALSGIEIEENQKNYYVIIGFTENFTFGGFDILAMKLNENGEIGENCNQSLNTNLTFQSANINSLQGPAEMINPLFDAKFTNLSPISTNASYYVCTNPEGPGAVPDNDNYIGTPLKIEKTSSLLKLTWGQPEGTCLTEDYSIYKGNLPILNYDHEAILCTTSGQNYATIDSDIGNYYYLVVAQHQGYEGSYGVDSNNQQRPIGLNPCLPQLISNCNE